MGAASPRLRGTMPQQHIRNKSTGLYFAGAVIDGKIEPDWIQKSKLSQFGSPQPNEWALAMQYRKSDVMLTFVWVDWDHALRYGRKYDAVAEMKALKDYGYFNLGIEPVVPFSPPADDRKDVTTHEPGENREAYALWSNLVDTYLRDVVSQPEGTGYLIHTQYEQGQTAKDAAIAILKHALWKASLTEEEYKAFADKTRDEQLNARRNGG